MAFTNDDLKRLKANLVLYGVDPGIDVCNYFDEPYEIVALLARLEAAEKALDVSRVCACLCADCKHLVLYEAWRKSKGD